jgi:hypothetical protein
MNTTIEAKARIAALNAAAMEAARRRKAAGEATAKLASTMRPGTIAIRELGSVVLREGRTTSTAQDLTHQLEGSFKGLGLSQEAAKVAARGRERSR